MVAHATCRDTQRLCLISQHSLGETLDAWSGLITPLIPWCGYCDLGTFVHALLGVSLSHRNKYIPLTCRHGDKHTRYEFYSSEDGDPVRLYMHGNDLFSGAHFDVYIADYYSYIPGHPDPSVFDLPGICDDKLVEERTGRSSYALQMMALLPAVRIGGVLYATHTQMAITCVLGAVVDARRHSDWCLNAIWVIRFNQQI